MPTVDPRIQCAHTEVVPLDSLKGHPHNTNLHGDEQVDLFVKILRYQGQRRAVTVSKLSGFVTRGHGLMMAAKKLGWKTVAIDRQDYKDEAQELADIHADNELARLAQTDEAKLRELMLKLPDGFDMQILGAMDLKLPGEEKKPGCGEDEVPETSEVVRVKIGDLFDLGVHRVLCGDCTVRASVSRLMGGDDKADMTFTSPPYNLGISAKLSGNSKIAKSGNAYGSAGYDDCKSEAEWLEFVISATEKSLEVSRYAFWNIQFLAGNRTALSRYWAYFADRSVDVIIWDKGFGIPQQAERVLNPRFEFVFVFTSDKNPSRAIRIAPPFRGTVENVLVLPRREANEFASAHGATFPVAFPEWFLERFKPKSVVEPFLGSGTTLIASEKHGSKCFGMDISPEYVQISIDRWQRFSGKRAYRLNTDGTKTLFDDIKPPPKVVTKKGKK